MEYIALDAHKRYSFASVENAEGGQAQRGSCRAWTWCDPPILERFERGSHVAVETVGNWYWIVSEIEEAGMVPKLVHALRAKMMLASTNKTDRLDAHGMNRLQRSGTLPTVWIPSRELRDQRELFRTRMVFAQQRTRLKNRIHATLAKYALTVEEASDAFGKKGRQSRGDVAIIMRASEATRFVGLDVHAQTISVAIAEKSGEGRSIGCIPNRPGHKVECLRGELRR